MTRREYLKKKIEKRRKWAANAKRRSKQHFESARNISSAIPLGQPILVGHHSEKRARRDAERIHNNMDKGMTERARAEYHEDKADGLTKQLDKSIFSDDIDAIEQLNKRIETNEKKAAEMIAINKAWRIYNKKGDKAPLFALGITLEGIAKLEKQIAAAYSWEKQPYPKWAVTNLRSRIRNDKKRIEQIKKRQARIVNAEASGGVLIEGEGDYIRVTFAEKPDREVIDALKTANFYWGGGSWSGHRDALPSCVLNHREQS